MAMAVKGASKAKGIKNKTANGIKNNISIIAISSLAVPGKLTAKKLLDILPK